ncbi:hypothetical protein PVK06_031471 [Gossypium arboreum]|uniref:Uncharacterized protein n=1 Tax=Gossypium arboreum TaxID=29729 RepID=A0ABR0NR33_GOSAR|nr:hypothetical protein PVK06_031471 [Gossypium arboreum]
MAMPQPRVYWCCVYVLCIHAFKVPRSLLQLKRRKRYTRLKIYNVDGAACGLVAVGRLIVIDLGGNLEEICLDLREEI